MLRELELKLRRYGPAFPDFDTVCDWVRKQSFDGAADWARAMQPLFSARCDDAPHPLALHIAAHLRLSEALARGTDTEGTGALWQAEAGVAPPWLRPTVMP